MIVSNIGYLNLESVLALEYFSIYETHKETNILVISKCSYDKTTLYFPKRDRLPWKLLEGKKICNATKIFDSKVNSIELIDISKWNNGNQIMSYKDIEY